MPPIRRLASLRGRRIAFTGRLASMSRDQAIKKARRCGASIGTHVTAGTEVVVQGAPSPNYKWADMGVKLAEVERFRADGRQIYVISEEEFLLLLKGQALSSSASRTAAAGVTDPLGVPFRSRPMTGTGGVSIVEVDLDAVDRARAAHERTVRHLADAVASKGYSPLTAASTALAFDLAWHGRTSVHVAEVKSLTAANEVQQLRLGLGQVLDYRQRLQRQLVNRSVRAHLVVSRKPDAGVGFDAVCASANVTLAWPEAVARVFRR